MDASDSGSADFFLAESDSSDSVAGERFLEEIATSVDGSSFLVELDSSEDTSDNGSGDRFLAEEESSSSEESADSSEDGSDFRLLIEVESSVDGSTLVDDLSLSDSTSNVQDSDESDDNAKDSVDSEDDGEDDVDGEYQPGTVKPAPIDDDSGVFDPSNLSWWK